MGTQKNRLNETVLLGTQNMLKLWIRKYLQFTLIFFFVDLNLCFLLGFVLILFGCEAQGCCRFARLFVDLNTYVSIDL